MTGIFQMLVGSYVTFDVVSGHLQLTVDTMDLTILSLSNLLRDPQSQALKITKTKIGKTSITISPVFLRAFLPHSLQDMEDFQAFAMFSINGYSLSQRIPVTVSKKGKPIRGVLWLTSPKNPKLVFLKAFLANAMLENLTPVRVGDNSSVLTMHIEISAPGLLSSDVRHVQAKMEAAVL